MLIYYISFHTSTSGRQRSTSLPDLIFCQTASTSQYGSTVNINLPKLHKLGSNELASHEEATRSILTQYLIILSPFNGFSSGTYVSQYLNVSILDFIGAKVVMTTGAIRCAKLH